MNFIKSVWTESPGSITVTYEQYAQLLFFKEKTQYFVIYSVVQRFIFTGKLALPTFGVTGKESLVS